ncbi:MAG: hypothetical protein ABS36_05390 [Acidobacteria bacterium SCN 69-37]|nr:MAG: hypothetical protein ABS36_05390 [Acidobacteria bacterium SCN 69-37]
MRVVDSGPRGTLNQPSDANEIRIVFSEPMVALGRIPSNPSIPWVTISPAVTGTFRWSGTTVLLFTPDPTAPLPWATTITVTVAGSATSVAGRTLGTPHTFSFTTPTPRLTSMRWYRRNDRFDRPVVLLLDFNQPMRAADVLAHASLRYSAHEIDTPTPSVLERARMNAASSTALRAFDAKITAARTAAARTDALQARATTDWDRERYPASDTLVVLETTTVPPPGTWIAVTLDAQLTGPGGPRPAGQAQTSVAELDPVFFAQGFSCRLACNPSGYNGLRFTAPVDVARFASALAVQDITTASAERPVTRTSTVPATSLDRSWSPELQDAGFDRQPPATIYAYRLDASLEAADGQPLGYPFVGIVETWHERAFTSFGDGHGVWETSGGPQIPFSSRNFTSVTQWLTRLQPSDLMPRIVALERNDFRDLPPGTGTTRQLPVTPDAIQAHGLDLGPVLSDGRGVVWAGLRPGTPIARADRAVREDRADRSTIVQVTNLGLSVKDSPQSTLVFVTRLDTGAPVSGAAVTIVNTDNQQLWRGTTAADGVVVAPALPLRDPDSWYSLAFLVTAEKDGDVAYLASNWNEGLLPWDFGHDFQLWESTNILRGSVFTDRGVYRPGETVHAKAILRIDTPTGIRLLPAGAPVDVRVSDSRGREVDRRTLAVTRWSSAEWEWTVPSESTLGDYTVQVAMPGADAPADANDGQRRRTRAEWLERVDGSFLVAAYRRPDFRVDAALTADSPVAGTRLSGHIDAAYLFGAHMADRPVRWSIQRALDRTIPAPILERFPDDQYAFGYDSDTYRGDERVAGADATLDASGTLDVSADTMRDVDQAWRYTLEGEVEDVSRQRIANRASLVVHPAPWYIGLRRPAYFADVATGTRTDVVAAALDGTPAAGVPVTVRLTRLQWNSVRRAEGSGFYTWDTEEIRTPAGEWQVTTAEAAVPLTIPVPEGGSYVLSATATDADGRTTKTETHFYALGRGYTAWQRYDHNRITLEPERRTWKPGETARVMIQSPWETATALLTVEREGIRRHERFTLTSTQQTVEVPITEDDIPNVFVSVLLVRGRTSDDPGADGSDPGRPAFRLGYAELYVDDASRQLTVDVSADRQEYRPANTARVEVRVHDAAGRPAAGEVTLWAVDHGVLSLTGYDAPDVRSAVYRRKALQVLNEDSRQRIVSRRVLTPKGGDDGGGGGFESGAGDVRRDFRPLAFWLGSVETGADGTASREVTLPESLTTYRIMAVAADSASRFGSAHAEITVNKPVTLLAAFPRFLTMGDQASFGATVSNTLTRGGRAQVTIRSLDPAILQITGNGSQTVELAPGATAAVRFAATARGTGTARVRMTVRLGNENDAFETTLPVTAPAPAETSVASSRVDDRYVERLAVPAGIIPGLGRLNVSLSSTALAGLGEGARYLVDYPYGCAEQRASAALALTLASDLGGAFAMAGIDAASARTRATTLLNDLPRFQCANGAFALWPGACSTSHAYLTAWILSVMKTAGTLGIQPDDATVDRALDFLDAEVRRTTPPAQVQWQGVWASSQAFAVKVLAEHGRNQDSNITRLMGLVDRLPVFALSYLADAMAASNQRGPRYADVIARLSNAIRIEGDAAHVQDVTDDALAWVWHSNVRTTAVVLEGLVRRGDETPVTAQMARWLLAAREDGRWGNTQENATALAALVAYYRRVEGETPNLTATVRIGSRQIGTATFRGRTTDAQQVQLAMPDLLRRVPTGSESELSISRAGTGALYVTTRLTYTPSQPIGATNAGMTVERRYERFVENGTGEAASSYAAGDLIRVTLIVTVPQERRYVVVTDPLPAGLEAVDGSFRTTASDLAREAGVMRTDDQTGWWFERSGFDHVERHDDRVTLFGTRLSQGRHEFSYLVRATTTGTFRAAGTRAEQMYAPEVTGRTDPAVIEVR